MVDIEFNYNQAITLIQSRSDEPFQDVINRYIQKSLLDPSSVYFFANAKQINPVNTVESQMNDLDKSNKKMLVQVHLLERDDQDNGQVITNSKDIICPTCKEPCRITFENFKIKLYECVNGHEIPDIKLIDFPDTQKINESLIICDKCQIKNKGNCPTNEFFRCLNCKQNLCLMCRPNHNLNHNIIQYDQKNYIF